MVKPYSKYATVIILVALLCGHVLMSKNYTERILQNVRNAKSEFYVFTPEAYKLFAVGANDLASRLIVLYGFYNPVNINIPSIDFARLIAALEGSVALDPQNIQPYLHIAYYWSWAKNEQSRTYMAAFMKNGVDKFPERWDIPYSLYKLLQGVDDEKSLFYLRLAAERAARYGGPDWIVDFPAILMSKQGETLEAILWLQETWKKTESLKQKEIIENMIESLIQQLKNAEEPVNN